MKDEDDDKDGLSNDRELLMGTHPLFADTDQDGIDDDTDAMPLCPNTVCDERFGEDAKSCPEDCARGGVGVIAGGIIFLVLLVVGVYLYMRFARGSHTLRPGSADGRSPQDPVTFDPGRYHQLQRGDKKSDKPSAVEKELEHSMDKAERFLRR